MVSHSDAVALHGDALRRAEAAIAVLAQRAVQDPLRPIFHLTAPGGWLNDPNGLCHWRGEYHAFWQTHPFDAGWGPMHWGHACSTDLAHWRRLPIALAPSAPWDSAPDPKLVQGVFSGSAVDDGGALTLLHTGHVDGRHPMEVQCLATSRDGIHFEKHPQPVIAAPPPEAGEDFRDPKVWRHDGAWWMVLGTTKDGVAKVLLHRSADLRRWDYRGVLCEDRMKIFGMWECPDCFALGGEHVLVVSPMRGARNLVMVGELDLAGCRFQPHTRCRLDWGPDFYAPQSFADAAGRRLALGWLCPHGAPNPWLAQGWNGCLTVPRELRLLPDGTVGSRPAAELANLRRQTWNEAPGKLEGRRVLTGRGRALEVRLRLRLDAGGPFGVSVLCDDQGRGPTIWARRSEGRLSIQRAADAGLGLPIEAPLQVAVDEDLVLTVLVDRSVVEVFAQDGRVVLSTVVNPDLTADRVALSSQGGAVDLREVTVHEMGSMWG
jgi:beta-fructofuranosidase